MRLFEIADEIEEILNHCVDPETGEITEEGMLALETLELQLKEKALAVAAYIKGELAEGEAVQQQADRLRDRAQRHKKRAESLKKYLQTHIDPGMKFSDDKSQIGWTTTTAVEITDYHRLPNLFLIERDPRPDKLAIRDHINSGNEVPGAILVKRKHLVIS